MSKNAGKVRCSVEGKPDDGESKVLGMGASLAVAACAAAASSPAVMALVDERMSTEGTGLPFGLSNNLLGWILLGVFALIWSLYFIYTSSLEEDEESGLSL
ncbi:Photosystem II reaction center W protein, chloroplastic [Sesamum angolense]|uniref:PSII 6.1 kDa protein n=1 Tax=Sesamum angolense TaxID=2727404 RepID=A0AAE1XA63_9LAMI|nr:Photosystem II reaction center W protein, chloroplastic [Sesamum angolense]